MWYRVQLVWFDGGFGFLVRLDVYGFGCLLRHIVQGWMVFSKVGRLSLGLVAAVHGSVVFVWGWTVFY